MSPSSRTLDPATPLQVQTEKLWPLCTGGVFKTEQKTEGNISHNAATFSLLFFQDVALADLAALNLLGSPCLQLLIAGIKRMCHRAQVSHGL